MVGALARAGVDVRPEAMGVSREDAEAAMRTWARSFAKPGCGIDAPDERLITAVVAAVRDRVEAAYSRWEGSSS